MYARMRMRCRTSALIGCCAEWCRHAYGGFTNVGALQAFLPSFLCLTCRLAMHHVIPCRILFHKLQCVLLHFELQCYCLRSDVKVWYRTVHLYYIIIYSNVFLCTAYTSVLLFRMWKPLNLSGPLQSEHF